MKETQKKLSHLSHIISTMHIKITAMTILYQNNNKKIKCEKKYLKNVSFEVSRQKLSIKCKLRLFEKFSNSVLLLDYFYTQILGKNAENQQKCYLWKNETFRVISKQSVFVDLFSLKFDDVRYFRRKLNYQGREI